MLVRQGGFSQPVPQLLDYQDAEESNIQETGYLEGHRVIVVAYLQGVRNKIQVTNNPYQGNQDVT